MRRSTVRRALQHAKAPVHLSTTRPEIQAFFAQVLRHYRAQGSTQGEMRRFEWVPLGVNSIAATITWAYKNATGQLLWEIDLHL